MNQKRLRLFFFFLGIGLLVANSVNSQGIFKEKAGVQIEAGYGIKSNENSVNVYQFFISPYYKVNENFSMGVGVGYMHHGELLLDNSFPVYFHSKYKLKASPVVNPFLNVKIGYGLGSNKAGVYGTGVSSQVTQSAGLFFSPSLGVNFNIASRHSVFLAVSYDLLKIKNSGESVPSLNTKATNSTIGFRIGYEF